mmetsp:Transcript_4041/g.11410  ORF Transcript_4041/g.11410 Transcript_4041/m.11410 type:complete len:263 (-) Transcript_4041:136-924(-)
MAAVWTLTRGERACDNSFTFLSQLQGARDLMYAYSLLGCPLFTHPSCHGHIPPCTPYSCNPGPADLRQSITPSSQTTKDPYPWIIPPQHTWTVQTVPSIGWHSQHPHQQPKLTRVWCCVCRHFPCRAELFNMINSNPTIFEIIQGKAKGPKPKAKVQPPATVGKPKKQMDSRPPGGQPKPKPPKRPAADPAPTDEGSEDEYDDGEGDPCPSCGGFYKKDEFWIACDGCETWYHGKCVKVNPQNAEKIKTWKCPQCVKRMRPN